MTEPQTTTSLAEMVAETVAVIGFEGAKLATRQDSTGDALYQKRIPTRGVPPWIQTAEIKFPTRRTADELCPVDLAHVAWAAQLGTIVFHLWPVRRSDVDEPDELRVNLDPRPGAGFPQAAELAQVEPDDFDLASVRECFAKIGDLHAAIDDLAHDLTPLLEWSEGDERDGQGDMPYPPKDQKVPGEPKRVQPSKDRDRNRDNAR